MRKPCPIFRWWIVRLIFWPVMFLVLVAYFWHWYQPVWTAYYKANEWLRRPQK